MTVEFKLVNSDALRVSPSLTPTDFPGTIGGGSGLLVGSSQYGFMVAGTSSGLLVGYCSQFRLCTGSNSIDGLRTVNLPEGSYVRALSLSRDECVLAVSTSSSSLLFYSMASLLDVSSSAPDTPLRSVSVGGGGGAGSALSHLSAHPSNSRVFIGVCGGQVQSYSLAADEGVSSSPPLSLIPSGVSCLHIGSSSGLLYVGIDGVGVQAFDLASDGLVKTVHPLQEGEKIMGILELDDYVIIGYDSDKGSPSIVVVGSDSSPPFDNVCFREAARDISMLAGWFSEWDTLSYLAIFGFTDSSDAFVLDRSGSSSFSIVDCDENARIELPLPVESDFPGMSGMFIDLTSSEEIDSGSPDVPNTPPMPIVFVTTFDGTMLAYHCVLPSKKRYPKMVTEIKKVPAVSDIVSKSSSKSPTVFGTTSKQVSSGSSKQTFSFGPSSVVKPPSSGIFGSPATPIASGNKGGFSFGATSGDTPSFGLGSTATTAGSPTKETNPAGFSFGAVSRSPQSASSGFGETAKPVETTKEEDKTGGFTFAAPSSTSKPSFGFAAAPKSTEPVKSDGKLGELTFGKAANASPFGFGGSNTPAEPEKSNQKPTGLSFGTSTGSEKLPFGFGSSSKPAAQPSTEQKGSAKKESPKFHVAKTESNSGFASAETAVTPDQKVGVKSPSGVSEAKSLDSDVTVAKSVAEFVSSFNSTFDSCQKDVEQVSEKCARVCQMVDSFVDEHRVEKYDDDLDEFAHSLQETKEKQENVLDDVSAVKDELLTVFSRLAEAESYLKSRSKLGLSRLHSKKLPPEQAEQQRSVRELINYCKESLDGVIDQLTFLKTTVDEDEGRQQKKQFSIDTVYRTMRNINYGALSKSAQVEELLAEVNDLMAKQGISDSTYPHDSDGRAPQRQQAVEHVSTFNDKQYRARVQSLRRVFTNSGVSRFNSASTVQFPFYLSNVQTQPDSVPVVESKPGATQVGKENFQKQKQGYSESTFETKASDEKKKPSTEAALRSKLVQGSIWGTSKTQIKPVKEPEERKPPVSAGGTSKRVPPPSESTILSDSHSKPGTDGKMSGFGGLFGVGSKTSLPAVQPTASSESETPAGSSQRIVQTQGENARPSIQSEQKSPFVLGDLSKSERPTPEFGFGANSKPVSTPSPTPEATRKPPQTNVVDTDSRISDGMGRKGAEKDKKAPVEETNVLPMADLSSPVKVPPRDLKDYSPVESPAKKPENAATPSFGNTDGESFGFGGFGAALSSKVESQSNDTTNPEDRAQKTLLSKGREETTMSLGELDQSMESLDDTKGAESDKKLPSENTASTGLFGSAQPTSAGFGFSKPEGPPNPSFGATAFGTQSKPSFGASSFGQSTTTSFGAKPASNPTGFGFGSQAASGFGASSQGVAAFGQPSQTPTAFGTPASQPAPTGSGFGASSFGQSSFGKSSFGSGVAAAPQSAPTMSGFGKSGGSLFGKSSYGNGGAPSSFGALASQSSGSFGGGAPAVQGAAQLQFGQQQTTTGFGNVANSSPQGQSIFGQSSFQQGPSGSSSSFTQFRG